MSDDLGPRWLYTGCLRRVAYCPAGRDADTPLDQNPKCSGKCGADEARPRHGKRTGLWAPVSLNGATSSW